MEAIQKGIVDHSIDRMNWICSGASGLQREIKQTNKTKRKMLLCVSTEGRAKD